MANDINISVGVFAGDALRDLAKVQNQVQSVGNRINSTTKVLNQHEQAYSRTAVATNKWAKGALQQTGYQLGDFFVQVTNGTSAMQAFGQQGSQILGVFGPVGAILGAAVAIFAAVGVAAERSGKQLGEFSVILGQLQQPIMAIGGFLKGLGLSFKGASEILLANIDTLIIALGLVALKFLATKAAAMLSAVAMAQNAAAAQYVAYQTALAGRALTAYEMVMVRARFAAITLGGAIRMAGAAIKAFLPIAILLGVAKLIEMFLQLKRGAGGFGEMLKLVGDLFKSFIDGAILRLEGIRLTMLIVGQGVKALFAGLMQQVTEFIRDQTNNLIRGVNQILRKFDLTPIEEVGSGWVDTFSGMLRSAQDSITQTSILIGGLNQRIEDSNAGIKASFDAIIAAYKAGEIPINIASEAISDLSAKGTRDLTAVEERTVSIADGIRDAMSSAFMSMVDGTKSVKEAFRDMARSIIMKLYEVLVVQQMVNSILGFLGFSAGPTGQLSNFRNPIPGMARGGPITGGKPYIVGEKGPELVIPSSSGRVIPNERLGGETVVVNQTINVSTGVQATVRNEIRSMMPMLAENAKAAVLDAKRRGGSYGRAMA